MVEPLLSAGDTCEAYNGVWKRGGVIFLISLCLVCCVLMILLPAASLAGDLVYRAF